MMSRTQKTRVVLYTRQGCGLCRGVEEMLQKYAKRCEVTVVDIDTDDTLLKRYGLRIPVVSVNGEEVAEGQISEHVVRDAIRGANAGPLQTRQSRWRFWA